MAQTFFPVYPEGTAMINFQIGVYTKDEKVIYFNGDGPIYQHDKEDYQSFRFITSQMLSLKTVKQVEIVNFSMFIKGVLFAGQMYIIKRGQKDFLEKRR